MDTALVAAVIAAAAAIVAAVVSWFAALQGRRSRDRDHAWARLVWAMRATSSQAEYDISRTVLERLRDVRWSPKADRDLARRALRRHMLSATLPVRRDREHDREDP